MVACYACAALCAFAGGALDLPEAPGRIFVFERVVTTHAFRAARPTVLFKVRETGVFALYKQETVTAIREYIDVAQTVYFGRPIAPARNRSVAEAPWLLDPEHGVRHRDDLPFHNDIVPYMTKFPFQLFFAPPGLGEVVDVQRRGRPEVTKSSIVRLATVASHTPTLEGEWAYNTTERGTALHVEGPCFLENRDGSISVAGRLARELTIDGKEIERASGELLVRLDRAAYPTVQPEAPLQFRRDVESLKTYDMLVVHDQFRLVPIAADGRGAVELPLNLQEIVDGLMKRQAIDMGKR